MKPLLTRFWDKVLFTVDCWEWQASKNNSRYGTFGIGNQKTTMAHRFSYELFNGKIPDGLEINHLCKNTSCVNPGHLEVVTRQQNVLKSNAPSAMQAKQTECKYGHPLSDSNLAIYNKKRVCRKCHTRRSMKYHTLKGAELS